VTKELALQQGFRKRGAIHGDEWRSAALTLRVKSLCDDSLARSGFSCDQDGDVSVCHALDDIGNRAHRGCLAYQVRGREAFLERLPQRSRLVPQLVFVQRALQEDRQLVELERLRQVVVGALTD
jgi:hypothetical protein